MTRAQVDSAAQSNVYDLDMYTYHEPPRHYWSQSTAGVCAPGQPLTRDCDVDTAIIGGGYTGLSAAVRLASEHQVSTAVFEAGCQIGWGASGRNGGFVSAGGSKLSVQEMIKRYGIEHTKHYWKTQIEAIEDLKAFISRDCVDVEMTGDGNLCVAHHPKLAPLLKAEAEFLKSTIGVDARYLSEHEFRSTCHAGAEAYGAFRIRPGFGINPVRLAAALGRAARSVGADIWTNAKIVAWQTGSKTHSLTTSTGLRIKARRVILATNGYTPNGINQMAAFRNVPAISSIIVTQPYKTTDLAGRQFFTTTPVFNARNLLSYYRLLPDGRLLFGTRGDTRGTPAAARSQMQQTHRELVRVLPAFSDAAVEYAWRGLVSLTTRKSMSICADPDDASVVFAFGCHGSGTAAMTWAGRAAADLVVGNIGKEKIPAVFRSLPRQLPPSNRALRWGLRTAYSYYALRDAFHL